MGYRTVNRNQRAKQLARIQETKDTRWHLIRQSKEFALKFVNDLQSCTYRNHTFQPE